VQEYVLAECLCEALAALSRWEGQGRIVAGGTDLMMDIADGKKNPKYLLDISRMGFLQQISDDNNMITIGAAVTHSQVAASPIIQAKASALAKAARSVGSLQIRNVGTVVGNVVNAQPAADTAVTLVALGAEANIATNGGCINVPVEEMYVGVGQSTVDSTRQLVTGVQFTGCQSGQGTGFARLSQRNALALPMLNVATMISLDGEVIDWARIVMAPVGPRPTRATKAEQFLVGKPADAATITEAAKIATRDANPRDSALRGSHRYRLDVLPTLVQRALTMALSEAKQTWEVKS
jgi:CO/xanthine dehydrogenase FAD-binding subunit